MTRKQRLEHLRLVLEANGRDAEYVLRKFGEQLDAAVAAEREACARDAENHGRWHQWIGAHHDIAAVIRARSKKVTP